MSTPKWHGQSMWKAMAGIDSIYVHDKDHVHVRVQKAGSGWYASYEESWPITDHTRGEVAYTVNDFPTAKEALKALDDLVRNGPPTTTAKRKTA